MLDDNNKQDIERGIKSVLSKLEASTKVTSVRTMKQMRARINELQENGSAIPAELAEAYNKLATDANAALQTDVGKMKGLREEFVGNLKDGLGDLKNGVEGIFGDVLDQLTNNPLFSFMKGFARTAFGLVGNLLPSLNQSEADLIDKADDDSEEPATERSMDHSSEILMAIERNTSGLLAIWADKAEVELENDTNDKLIPEIPSEDITPAVSGLFGGFLASIATTIRTAMFGGALLAFLTNPLTIGIIALTAGLALLYTKWDDWNIGERLNDLPKVFMELWDEYGKEFSLIILGVFKKIGDTIGSIFGNPKMFENLGIVIGGYIFDAIEGINEAIEGIGTYFGDLYSSTVDTLMKFLNDATSFFGDGDDETTKRLADENRDKSTEAINKRLYDLDVASESMFGNFLNDNDEERAALNQLLQDRKLNQTSMASSIQSSGENRKNQSSIVTVQNNSNTSVNNTSVNESPAIKMESSRNGGGAYTMKQMLRNQS